MLVLAGGDSRRMGADKLTLRIGASTLLERALACARAVGLPTVIAGRAHPLDGVPTDIARCEDGPGEGPVAGLLGAASRWPRSAWLVLASDLPLLSSALLVRLVELATQHPHAAAVVPQAGGRLHPLSAWYAPAMVARLGQAAAEGRFGMQRVLEERPWALSATWTEADPVLHADAARLGWSEDQLDLELLNCNRPGDLARVRRILADRAGSPRTASRAGVREP